jgi:hypothetical protein
VRPKLATAITFDVPPGVLRGVVFHELSNAKRLSSCLSLVGFRLMIARVAGKV